MQLIDTHTHLYNPEFKEDLEQVILRAKNVGVQKFILPSIDKTHTQNMYALQKKYPDNVALMMGLHPVYVKENYKEELLWVAQQLSEKKFVAIGEIGMDLYWDTKFLKEQKEAFISQIHLAKKYKLPINIHCRNAFEEVFEVLDSENDENLQGIFHCFTGNLEQAKKILSYGLKLGIGGIVTFKNGKIDRFLSEIPLSEIVLETDAPYLAPAPFRGKRNEPSYLKKICEKLASIYQTTPENIGKMTTQNAKNIFKF